MAWHRITLAARQLPHRGFGDTSKAMQRGYEFLYSSLRRHYHHIHYFPGSLNHLNWPVIFIKTSNFKELDERARFLINGWSRIANEDVFFSVHSLVK